MDICTLSSDIFTFRLQEAYSNGGAYSKSHRQKAIRKKALDPEVAKFNLKKHFEKFKEVTDNQGVKLLNERSFSILESALKHVGCLSEPKGIPLYKEVGTIQIGTLEVPIYKSMKGTSQLENFHKHLKNFVPADTCSGERLHRYHMEGTYRWNKFRENEILQPAMSKTLGLTKNYTLINSYSNRLFNKSILPERCLRDSNLRGKFSMDYLLENQKIRRDEALKVFIAEYGQDSPATMATDDPAPAIPATVPSETFKSMSECSGSSISSSVPLVTNESAASDDPVSAIPSSPSLVTIESASVDTVPAIPAAIVPLESTFEGFGSSIPSSDPVVTNETATSDDSVSAIPAAAPSVPIESVSQIEEVNSKYSAKLFNFAKLLGNIAINDKMLELYEEKTITKLFNELEVCDKHVTFPRHYKSKTKETKKFVKPSRSNAEGCEQMIRQKLSRKKTCISPHLNALSECLIDRLHMLVLLEKKQPELIYQLYVNVQEKLIKSKYISRNSELVLVTQNLINIKKYLLKKSNQNVLYQISGQTRNLVERMTTTEAPQTTAQNSTAASPLLPLRPLVPASSSRIFLPSPAASEPAHVVKKEKENDKKGYITLTRVL